MSAKLRSAQLRSAQLRTRVLVCVVVLFCLPLLASCYTPAGRTAGDVIDDSTISTMVKAKLFENKKVSGLAINVTTFERVVTLTGAVDNPQQIEIAEDITRSVKEVKDVNNLLKLK